VPTYTCTTEAGRLSKEQRLKVAECIAAVHSEETGAPRYLVQVIFYDLAPDSHYVAGRSAPTDQIWVRGDIRRKDQRAEEPDARADNAWRRQGHWRRGGRGLGLPV
jgi:phenylpyruvate tautomerase PptA (4-oxalocrotonate tautomerase family)